MTEAHGPPRGSAPNGLPSLRDERDDRLEPVLLDEREMLGEALVAADAIPGAADRPVAAPC